MTILLATWLAFPSLYRIYHRFPLRYWVRVLPQDAAVATQASVIFALLHVATGPSAGWAIACAVVLFTSQTYLLLDALLYRRAGIRLSPSLLLMVRYASTFESSASPLQLIVSVGSLWACLSAVTIYVVWPQRMINESLDPTFAIVMGV